MNFNPTIDFDGNDIITSALSGVIPAGNTNTSMYVVYVKDDTGRTGITHHSGSSLGFHIEAGSTGSSLVGRYDSGGSQMNQTLEFGANEPFLYDIHYTTGGALEGYSYGGDKQTTAIPRGDVPTVLKIGEGDGSVAELTGGIAEIITYSATHTSGDDRQKIQAYLALKYGMTLDSGNLAYKNSAGTDTWAVDATYKNNIFGIARDDASTLNQEISKSANAESILTLSTDTDFTTANDGSRADLTNMQSLIMASDGVSATTAWDTASAPINYALLGETWKVKNTGGVTGVSIQIDVDDADNNVPTFVGDLYLVKGSDLGTATPVVMTDAGGGLWTASGVDLVDGDLVSFAVSNDPVE
jgi:hypothetical protein